MSNDEVRESGTMSETELLGRFEADLSAYIDGELDPARRAELETALARSAPLRRRLEALRRVDSSLGELPASQASAALRGKVRAAIDADGVRPARREPEGVAAPRRVSRLSRFAPVLAGAVAAAAAWLLVWTAGPTTDSPPAELATGDRVPGSEVVPGRVVDPEQELVEIEREFAGVLDAEQASDPDIAVVEVLDFLEELGDLSETGRG